MKLYDLCWSIPQSTWLTLTKSTGTLNGTGENYRYTGSNYGVTAGGYMDRFKRDGYNPTAKVVDIAENSMIVEVEYL